MAQLNVGLLFWRFLAMVFLVWVFGLLVFEEEEMKGERSGGSREKVEKVRNWGACPTRWIRNSIILFFKK